MHKDTMGEYIRRLSLLIETAIEAYEKSDCALRGYHLGIACGLLRALDHISTKESYREHRRLYDRLHDNDLEPGQGAAH